jgi:hypothetical protein
MPPPTAETVVTEHKGSALRSFGGLLLAAGGALILHEWSLLPAPQDLLPLLGVYMGVRGARHTQRSARVVSVLIALLGVLAQAAILNDLPPSELGLLAPIGTLIERFGGAFGLLTRAGAVALLAGGALLISRARKGAAIGATGATGGTGGASGAADRVDHFAMFSGLHRSVASRAFRGGRLVALFGGLELDLTGAVMTPDARLDVWATFGGVSIEVPKGCEVVVQAVPIFGGVSAAGRQRPLSVASGAAPPAGRLIIGGIALFGGIDIRS